MARQERILNRKHPPRVTLLVDELSLYRCVGSATVMTGQLDRLGDIASMPNVTLQVVPAIAHAGVASAYLLADDAVWCEHVAAGGAYTDPNTFAYVAAKHDSLRAECFRASESTAFLKEVAEKWASGGLRVIAVGQAGSA
jgi:hypothetical protein